MIFIQYVMVCASALLLQSAVAEPPKFRILAPQFVCPKDKDAVIDKPDNTVVILQPEPGVNVKYQWTVRWHPLVTRDQRFTLKLWRSVRELEKKLNQAQIEQNVFIINNTELQSGVDYIFNVTATSLDTKEVTEKVFQINNIKGDQQLLIEGRSDMFSINLIGGQLTFYDLEFTLEAQVTTCYKTQDYYFVWSVSNSEDTVNVSDINGSRLEIHPDTLSPGHSYDVVCQAFRYSTREFITQSSLPFRVQHRKLEVHFNIDVLVISVDNAFTLQTDVNNLDYDGRITVTWECTFEGEPVYTFYTSDKNSSLIFPVGLPNVGEYSIKILVIVPSDVTAEARARVIIVQPPLPVIKILYLPRVLNENSVTTLKAHISKVTPGCSVTWYFSSEQCMSSTNTSENCGDSEHGVPISKPVNFYSLEENFLSELTDYSNETQSKSVFTDLEAAAGRARVVAECSYEVNNYTGEGVVYADIMFQINDKPLVGGVSVTPETGVAMETIFRLSTLAVDDLNKPLRYDFYCELNDNDTVLLGSYLEHSMVETLLPYIDGGTVVWVKVCDSLGACSSGTPTIIVLSPGEARSVDALLNDTHAHIQRCELTMLQRLASSAVITYTNADQTDTLTKFTSALLDSLASMNAQCIKNNYNQYSKFVHWLARTGVDISHLKCM